MTKSKMYKLVGSGSNNQGEVIDRIVLEGPSYAPTSFIDSTHAAELTDEQVKKFRASGHKLSEVDGDKVIESGDDPSTPAQQQAAQAPETGSVSNIKK